MEQNPQTPLQKMQKEVKEGKIQSKKEAAQSKPAQAKPAVTPASGKTPAKKPVQAKPAVTPASGKTPAKKPVQAKSAKSAASAAKPVEKPAAKVEEPKKKRGFPWKAILIIAVVLFVLTGCALTGRIAYAVMKYQDYQLTNVKVSDPPAATTSQEEQSPVVQAPVVQQPVVQQPVVQAPVVSAPQTSTNTSQTNSEASTNQPSAVNLVPVGGMVDLSNQIAKPQGFPDNWKSMSVKDQSTWVASVVNGPVESVLGEPSVGFAFNGKGVITHNFVCPLGFTCHWHLVDGDRTVFFRGHGETAEVYAATFRIEALIPGGGGLCQNWNDVLVYEASIGNLVTGLGEVNQCPPLPASRLAEINTKLGERLREVEALSGVQVISIGTVGKGFGAFWVYTNNLGTQDITCPAGFTCLYTTDGTTWTWVDGEAKITGAQGAILFDKAVVSDPQSVASTLTK